MVDWNLFYHSSITYPGIILGGAVFLGVMSTPMPPFISIPTALLAGYYTCCITDYLLSDYTSMHIFEENRPYHIYNNAYSVVYTDENAKILQSPETTPTASHEVVPTISIGDSTDIIS